MKSTHNKANHRIRCALQCSRRYMHSMTSSGPAIQKFLILSLVVISLNVQAASEKIFQRNIGFENYQSLEDSGVKILLSVLNGSDTNGDGKIGNVQISVSSIATVLPKLNRLRYTTESPNSSPTSIPIDFSDIQAVFSVSFLELRNARLDLLFNFSQGTNEEKYYYQVNLLDVAKIQSKDNTRLHSELIMHGLLE